MVPTLSTLLVATHLHTTAAREREREREREKVRTDRAQSAGTQQDERQSEGGGERVDTVDSKP
jgi:hypothetical protein